MTLLLTRASCVAALLMGLQLLLACEPPRISELPADEGIARIRETHDDERYDIVISEVDEFRSRYPYSKHAAEAELLQADAFFQSGRYPEAIATYESFVAKNPKHPQTGFAQFRAARSIDEQSPEEIDREQLYSERAIESYGLFLEKHPDNENVPEAKERISVLRRRVAGHYLFIARFYWKKDLYHSALSRYLRIVEDYPMYPDMRKEALERASEAYEKLAEKLEEDPDDDSIRYFKSETPASLRAKAQSLKARGRKPPEPNP